MKQNPAFDQWCRTAAGYVPRSRRSTVYAELYAHLEDHYLTLTAQGLSFDEAIQQALAAMGDPVQVGKQLRKAEWTGKGMLRQLHALLIGQAWEVYYRGTDERRYAQLRQAFSAAQIEFRAEELDPLSRTIGSISATGRSAMDHTPRRDGSNPGLMAAAQFHMWSNSSTVYLLYLRRRDRALAQKLERT